MTDLQLEQLLDSVAILIASRKRKDWARWLFYLVGKIADEQLSTRDGTKNIKWVEDLVLGLQGLCNLMRKPA